MTDITLIICVSIVLSILFISIAISYCYHQSCKARLKELTTRQKFEKEKFDSEQAAILKKWELEDKVCQLEHDWKKENKNKEEAL